MHTEHLQNVTIGRVVAAWLVAIAVTSLAMLVMTSVGVSPEGDATWWGLLPVAAGFFAGGLFVGMRAMQAPVLHGIAIGIMSLVAWVIVNVVLFGVMAPHLLIARSESLTAPLIVALMLVQITAAVVGALIGYNMAVRGKPGLAEHEPLV